MYSTILAQGTQNQTNCFLTLKKFRKILWCCLLLSIFHLIESGQIISFVKRAILNCQRTILPIFGLSKVERPILDHHTKAHNLKSGGFHTDFMKSGGFHHELWQISPWNPADFMKSIKSGRFQVKSGGFQVKSPAFIKLKSFCWNTCFYNFGWQISWNPWNLVDFRWNPPKIIKASVSAKTLQFDECRVGAMGISPLKSSGFHPEIWWISPVKSGGFHRWNPPSCIHQTEEFLLKHLLL